MSSSSSLRTSLQAGAERGSIAEVFRLAAPVMLTQLSATAMGVVDSAMVGRLGATELAAVGFAAIWTWTVFSLFFGTASGVQTFVSQADGAGEPSRCGRWVWQTLYGVAPPALLVVACAWPLAGWLISHAGLTPELQASASVYMETRLPGEIGFVVVSALTGFFRGIGDTRTPLYATLLANAVNAVLDYGLVFGELGLPEWGVAGAGLATALSHWVAVAALLVAFRRRRVRERYATQPVAPRAAEIRRFLRTGLPIGGQWWIGMTSFAAFTTLVARMGETPMAASQAFLMLLSLSFMQAVGLSTAASTLVGRYVGARDLPAAYRSFRSALSLAIALAACVACLFVLAPGPLLRIFSDDPGVLALGTPLLLLGAIFQLFDAVAIVSEGSLRGAGDTRWPFLVDTAFGWGVFLPLAYLFGVVLDYGLHGAWVGGTLALCASSALLTWRFRSGAWERIRI